MENIHELHRPAFNDNGDLLLKEDGKHVAIVFSRASWCGHCTAATPGFQGAADTMDNVLFATIDHSGAERGSTVESQEVAEFASKMFDIRGFPTFNLFVDGKRVPDFKLLDRSAEGITNAITHTLG